MCVRRFIVYIFEKQYMGVLWIRWKADGMKELRMRELRVRELLVRRLFKIDCVKEVRMRELCLSKLCMKPTKCEGTQTRHQSQFHVTNFHACDTNSSGVEGLERDPSVPPEPAQRRKCHACHTK